MRVFVAIDDTDNLESKGTGFRARDLSAKLQQQKCGNILGVTRHQLFVHEHIPYTSHNSSACIVFDSSDRQLDKIIDISAEYLRKNAAEGSDAGLCVCTEEKVNEEVKQYALKAKTQVLTMEMARELAAKNGIFLQGYTGTHQGIIGALAAVGLHAGGNDGRFLLAKGMREVFGKHTADEVLKITGVQAIKTLDNKKLFTFETVFLTEWWRPVLKDSMAVLYVEPTNQAENEYTVISKEHIKHISN